MPEMLKTYQHTIGNFVIVLFLVSGCIFLLTGSWSPPESEVMSGCCGGSETTLGAEARGYGCCSSPNKVSDKDARVSVGYSYSSGNCDDSSGNCDDSSGNCDDSSGNCDDNFGSSFPDCGGKCTAVDGQAANCQGSSCTFKKCKNKPTPHDMPREGGPANSTLEMRKVCSGNLHRIRTYDGNGDALEDEDYDSPHGQYGIPHTHRWIKGEDGKPKRLDPGE